MHNGFYDQLDDIRECSVEHHDITNPLQLDFMFMCDEEGIDDITPYDFLHGNCNIFSRYLHNTYGYRINTIYDRIGLIHSYCTVDIDGKMCYIDVRGITDDAEEFWREFGYVPKDVLHAGKTIRHTNKIPSVEEDEAEKLFHAAEWIDHQYQYWNIEDWTTDIPIRKESL